MLVQNYVVLTYCIILHTIEHVCLNILWLHTAYSLTFFIYNTRQSVTIDLCTIVPVQRTDVYVLLYTGVGAVH